MRQRVRAALTPCAPPCTPCSNRAVTPEASAANCKRRLCPRSRRPTSPTTMARPAHCKASSMGVAAHPAPAPGSTVSPPDQMPPTPVRTAPAHMNLEQTGTTAPGPLDQVRPAGPPIRPQRPRPCRSRDHSVFRANRHAPIRHRANLHQCPARPGSRAAHHQSPPLTPILTVGAPGHAQWP